MEVRVDDRKDPQGCQLADEGGERAGDGVVVGVGQPYLGDAAVAGHCVPGAHRDCGLRAVASPPRDVAANRESGGDLAERQVLGGSEGGEPGGGDEEPGCPQHETRPPDKTCPDRAARSAEVEGLRPRDAASGGGAVIITVASTAQRSARWSAESNGHPASAGEGGGGGS